MAATVIPLAHRPGGGCFVWCISRTAQYTSRLPQRMESLIWGRGVALDLNASETVPTVSFATLDGQIDLGSFGPRVENSKVEFIIAGGKS